MKKTLLFFLILPFVGMAQSQIYDRLLAYENFEHNKPLLPKEISSSPEVDPYVKNHRFQIDEDRYKNAYKLSDSSLDFFYELDIINGWPHNHSEYIVSKQDHIKSIKKGNVIYYLGKLKLSAKYDSYLILNDYILKEKEEYLYLNAQELYLINVMNDSIQSITQLAQYFNSGGIKMVTYTILKEKQKFVLIEKEFRGDEIILGEKPPKQQKKVTFHFDNKGYLHVQGTLQ